MQPEFLKDWMNNSENKNLVTSLQESVAEICGGENIEEVLDAQFEERLRQKIDKKLDATKKGKAAS